MTDQPVHIVGGGLAGSEAAWQLARAGVPVILHEMRGVHPTDAHETDRFAELVCSNSFRSDDATANAVGVLHEEMRRLGSLIMRCGDEAAVPAGSALAVDRDIFAGKVTAALEAEPLVEIRRERVERLPGAGDGQWIVATGPLTATPLAEDIAALTGVESLAFFDAIAPIVHRDSIDMDIAWMQSRWDKGDGKDYINCPLDRDQYEAFIDALLDGEKTVFKEWEENTPYFDGCMPIEVMAERGRDTLRFGPMKPVGLTNPATGKRAWAVIQLRQDNALGTLWNIVGFQTKLKYGEQTRIFRTIPGLEKAEFARLGGLHRNTFIKSPVLLDETLRLKARPNIRFAGQITGCEGYIESASVGLMAGLFAAAEARGLTPQRPPETTAHGALLSHITGGADAGTFQPMNVNFGLFPALEEKHHKKERKAKYAARALSHMDDWIGARAAA
ncbi:methylenetetrahydrofolate--tRNA-(uracil(54)-C(5))-methyltransferase (FADH(2)-oxidizing) TrmFO [Pacificimonas flava]|uniref:Methylenetetrahydrofolate--tRNA-(uracil-5-)-methyltransferase TrmFO n=1 Tax=Pacificimonas flava TaxID=1234595 RepID=M2TRX0_9SPHN|nr:methylenetetrahydrofolate--tRNA-(uracil(54)-C(5))-methyltransferase (FADH(2)-oxidizing) TrmFO [Pacificimonas flava]EMD84541.1 tRNA:m(5)U-54 MTase gid [Pacificimonas flava]MBB5279587.1 methylenetetrahydrofolate--tRNA-(uracil-5-)-methyltransferase [Pacificimonas flava]